MKTRVCASYSMGLWKRYHNDAAHKVVLDTSLYDERLPENIAAPLH